MGGKVRLAILGGGNILGAHAPGYIAHADLCEVVAVAEANPAAHARVRELLKKDVPIYGDYREVLDLPGLDAVDILLPHSMHMEAAVAAAGKGLHVLCEKVMARNAHECAAMVGACERAGVILMVAHDRRYNAEWASLKEAVESGGIGEAVFARLEHNQDVRIPKGSWIWSRDGIGGGAVMSCLTHQIDALRWYLGEVASVTCMTKSLDTHMEGECIGAVTARMRGGALAMLSINWHTKSASWRAGEENNLWYEYSHIYGTRGEAYYMSGKGAFMKSYESPDGEGGFVRLEPKWRLSGHQRCIGEFLKAVAGQPAEVLTPGSDSMKTVEVAEAAYLSEALGRVVELPIRHVPWDEREYQR
ncbi:MAG: Gfo/Idh/MocA family oxidoreductase [Oscillospiraceae bacterium]|nr:Gfo/Idh/MocA family oxidoreductase [Oscillospiraceae bacterium]